MLATAAVMLFTAFIFGWNNSGRNDENHIYQISYIYRNSSIEESQQAVRQGIEQAAKDYKCEVTAVAFEPAISPTEQLELVSREVKNGADAVLIEPLNSEETADGLAGVQKKIPVIQVNTWFESDGGRMPSVHIDNYKMGKELAQKIVKDMGAAKQVLLVKSEMEYTDVYETYRGVKEYLERAGVGIKETTLSAREAGGAGTVPGALKMTDADAVAVFGTMQLELCGKLKKENTALSHTKIYGFGKSNQIISYLEEEMIQAIGVPNEYSTGYLGVMKAVSGIKGERQEDKNIDYSIIERDNIYTTKNQRLLFPFVQ